MIRLLLCFLLCTFYLTAQPSENDLSRAHSYFVTGDYMHALNGYKAIVYYYVPPNFTIEQIHEKVPVTEIMLFCNALEGKIETEKKLGILNLSDDSRILNKIHPNAPKVTKDGDSLTIDMSQVQNNEDLDLYNDIEFEEFVAYLRKTGTIEKNEDVVWDEETKTMRLKMIKPCCKDCADGKPCIDEKKSQ